MSAYILGSLVGRFFMSALFVYVILLIFKRFNAGEALRKMKSPWSIMGVVFIFLLGLAGSTHAAEQERALRPFNVTDFPEAGLVVYVPSRPEWNINTERRRDGQAILLSTPPNYYPPAVIEVLLVEKIRVKKSELLETAVSALNTSRKNGGISGRITKSDLKLVKYGKIEGYLDQYEITAEGQVYTMNSIMGILPNGKSVLLSLVTAQGQISHIEHMAHKIWGRLRELPGKNEKKS